jgi:hypothetical protein
LKAGSLAEDASDTGDFRLRPKRFDLQSRNLDEIVSQVSTSKLTTNDSTEMAFVSSTKVSVIPLLDGLHPMSERSHSKMVVFRKPFLLKSIGRVLPAGEYRVITDEELIEGLSFPVYRRLSTMIFAPAQSHPAIEMITIDPLELQTAQDEDAG